MNDSLYFRLVIATVFIGALLAVFDPANRSPTLATTRPVPATTHQLVSSN